MPDDFSVEVLGLRELGETLSTMPLKFQQRIQRAALKAAGEVMAADMEARCPVAPKASHKDSEPGELRDSIGVKIRVSRDLSDSVTTVGPMYGTVTTPKGQTNQDPGVYSRMVEYGTFKMAPQPFIRPAFDATKEQAQEAYTGVVSALLDQLTDAGWGE